jgi:polyvinyl alcohol dehydrogenase (cytochrome)
VASLGDCPLTRGALVRIDLDRPDPAQIKYLAPVGEIGAGIWSTPAIDAKTDTVFVTTGTGDQDADAGMWGASMLSLDASTLEIKMFFVLPTSSIEEDIEWGSSPTLFEDSSGLELVGATGKDGVLYVRKRQDLTPVWQTKLAVQCPSPQDGCGAISTPAFDGARLYVGAGAAVDAFGSGSLYAVDPGSGDVIWSATMEGTVLAPVTVAGGLVFASTTLGMAVYDAGTGDAVWADPRPGALYSQPVVADGTLYTTYVNGDVVGWRLPATE